MSGNPYMRLIQNGIDIIDPMKTKLRGTIDFEPFVWLGTGYYEIEKMGSFSYVGEDAWVSSVSEIGRCCSIARGFVAGESEHPTTFLSSSPIFYSKKYWNEHPFMAEYYRNCSSKISETNIELCATSKANDKVKIGNDVWIGEGVFIRKGVTIGDGAVIAARAVVNKDVAPYSVVGGVPAKLLKMRFPDKTVEKLIALKWWDYDIRGFKEIDFKNIDSAILRLELAIANKEIKPYEPKIIRWN